MPHVAISIAAIPSRNTIYTIYSQLAIQWTFSNAIHYATKLISYKCVAAMCQSFVQFPQRRHKSLAKTRSHDNGSDRNGSQVIQQTIYIYILQKTENTRAQCLPDSQRNALINARAKEKTAKRPKMVRRPAHKSQKRS